jgi:hypothetical protein
VERLRAIDSIVRADADIDHRDAAAMHPAGIKVAGLQRKKVTVSSA